ncbi:protein disulfide-isomerase A3-like, partial [Limulus polyphemus]|uniref:protein disulfide-isomerase n=1 Tax=Limulus polyphemus TaxID=6850 RepID=A0ABM1C2X0_LIMPO
FDGIIHYYCNYFLKIYFCIFFSLSCICSHGLAGHRTQENFLQFKSPLVVAYFNVDYDKNTKGTNYWRNRIMKVAEKFKNKLNFAVSSKNEFAGEMSEFDLTAKDDKPVFGARDEKGQKFRMEDEYSPENLEKFLQNLIDGNLKPHTKSEPIPESNDGPVKVAVGENFNELVVENDKDILVEFYAPWCGHCKKLAPTYEELGKELQNEDGVEIVKMDATANDVPPSFEVQGFPTLYWVPKNQKDKPRKYEGGRELEDFIKYISKHATDELKGWDRKGNKRKTEL